VLVVLASANRDARQFRDPDRLDVKREPNRHLAFGQGIHYCLGAPLARLEGQIAIDTLLRRMPALRLRASPDSLRWRGGVFLRGLAPRPAAAPPPSRDIRFQGSAARRRERWTQSQARAKVVRLTGERMLLTEICILDQVLHAHAAPVPGRRLLGVAQRRLSHAARATVARSPADTSLESPADGAIVAWAL
jgi:hypothetical protein